MSLSATFPLRNAPAALVTLLAAARAEGVTINRTKVAKLLYLADLRAIERVGRPLSGFRWIWYNNGPWDHLIYPTVRDLAVIGVVEDETLDCGTYVEQRLRLRGDIRLDCDVEFEAIVAGIVHEYGHYVASTLRDITYQTPPMQEVQREGQRGDALDLNGGAPIPDLTQTLRHFEDVLDRLPDQSDEGDLGQMLAEHRELATGRSRANTVILR